MNNLLSVVIRKEVTICYKKKQLFFSVTLLSQKNGLKASGCPLYLFYLHFTYVVHASQNRSGKIKKDATSILNALTVAAYSKSNTCVASINCFKASILENSLLKK